MHRYFVALWLAVFCAASPVAAQQAKPNWQNVPPAANAVEAGNATAPAQPQPKAQAPRPKPAPVPTASNSKFPELTARVVDQAGLLDPAQATELSSKLEGLETQSGRQFVVATVNSLNGMDISEYATELGRAWKIGDEQKNDGVVMVVAPNERKVWIATGYGADDVLTDTMTGLIVRTQILPRFKAGDMAGGIIAGADAVIEQLTLPPDEAARRAKEAERNAPAGGGGGSIFPVIFFMVIIFMMLGGLRRSMGGRRYRSGKRGGGIDPMVVLWGLDALSRASRGGSSGGWGGGGSWGGGGGFSGGGGSFGGGGAGGSW